MFRDPRHKIFQRRTALLVTGKLTLFAVLAAQMVRLRLIESERYKTLSDENRFNLRLLVPARGRISDRHGVSLSVNQRNYRAVIVAEQSSNVERTLRNLARIISLSDRDRSNVMRDLKRHAPFVPVLVRENLNWTEVSKVEVNAPDLSGFSIDVGQHREYPAGYDAAHVLGYVGPVFEDEISTSRSPGYQIFVSARLVSKRNSILYSGGKRVGCKSK